MRKLLAGGEGDLSNLPSRDKHVAEYPEIKICFLLNRKLDQCPVFHFSQAPRLFELPKNTIGLLIFFYWEKICALEN